LTKNNTNVVPNPPYFSVLSQLKLKLEGRHFDTSEVIKAELQAVLNTLTEHNFQDAFKQLKNDRSAWNDTYAWMGTILRR
jgi:hypothetical protein